MISVSPNHKQFGSVSCCTETKWLYFSLQCMNLLPSFLSMTDSWICINIVISFFKFYTNCKMYEAIIYFCLKKKILSWKAAASETDRINVRFFFLQSFVISYCISLYTMSQYAYCYSKLWNKKTSVKTWLNFLCINYYYAWKFYITIRLQHFVYLLSYNCVETIMKIISFRTFSNNRIWISFHKDWWWGIARQSPACKEVSIGFIRVWLNKMS